MNQASIGVYKTVYHFPAKDNGSWELTEHVFQLED